MTHLVSLGVDGFHRMPDMAVLTDAFRWCDIGLPTDNRRDVSERDSKCLAD